MQQKVVLAYSGGLDTSYCITYLSQTLNLDVYSVFVDCGGFKPAELESIADRARVLGVKTHTVLDVKTKYYQECIRYLIFGNVLKNGTYPLSVSAERVFQARAIAEFAQKMQADYVAHGSTGAGNDQVRFDTIFHTLIPQIKILTPIRDQQLTREAEITFLKENGINLDWQKLAYSVNQGLWGTTIGGKETLTSNLALPEEAFPTPVTRNDPMIVKIEFMHGAFCGFNGTYNADPISAIQELDRFAAAYGIGRDMHVGDTIIGIKGRIGFAAAAPLLIIHAHKALEKHTLTKWQQYWKEQLAVWYGMLLHEGQFLDPVMRNIEAFLEHTQKSVTGTVHIEIAPYRFSVQGVTSPNDLMAPEFGSYGEQNPDWSGDDVRGFAKILANQCRIYTTINSGADND